MLVLVTSQNSHGSTIDYDRMMVMGILWNASFALLVVSAIPKNIAYREQFKLEKTRLKTKVRELFSTNPSSAGNILNGESVAVHREGHLVECKFCTLACFCDPQKHNTCWHRMCKYDDIYNTFWQLQVIYTHLWIDARARNIAEYPWKYDRLRSDDGNYTICANMLASTTHSGSFRDTTHTFE